MKKETFHRVKEKKERVWREKVERDVERRRGKKV